MTGDGRLALAVACVAVIVVYATLGLWARGVLRRWRVRNAGCPACAYRKGGECSCDRKCVNPDCKGGEGR